MAWIRTAQIRVHDEEHWWCDLHQFFLCLPKSLKYENDYDEHAEDDNFDDYVRFDEYHIVFHSEVSTAPQYHIGLHVQNHPDQSYLNLTIQI
jgi:hypothetical protein